MGIGLGQIADVLARLEGQALRVDTQQCLRVRHRKSTCTRCADECPVQAITFADGLQVDSSNCTGCSLCAAVCPTGAIESHDPTNAQLLAQIKEMAPSSSSVAFACPKSHSHSGKSVQIRCLGRLDESILVGAVSHGMQQVILVDTPCEGCVDARGRTRVEEAVTRANSLLQLFGIPPRIAFGSLAPEPAPEQGGAAGVDVSRRAFFGRLVRETARATAVTVGTVLSTQDNDAKKESKVGELPKRLPEKRQLLLEALSRLDLPEAAKEESGLWASFSVKENCTNCGMCAFFCPTGALTKTVDGNTTGLAFKAAACTRCGLCELVCFWEAVSLSSSVDIERIIAGTVENVALPAEAASGARLSPEAKIKRVLDSLFS